MISLFRIQGLPWPYSGECPPSSYLFLTQHGCRKFRFATTYWLDLDETDYRPLVSSDTIEVGVLQQLYKEHFDPDQLFHSESALYTIQRFVARANPWGLLVVFTIRGEEARGWSMIALKLNETALVMEDEKSQKAFERLLGVETVENKLKAAKFSMDTWFTGGDFASEAMRQIQTAVRRRLDWFVFENVPEYPTDFLAPLEQKYAYEETLISPQRFGKPMNRQILKLLCPMTDLKMNADAMFWMKPSELAHWHF
eukprot:s1532_g10.t1